VIKVNEMTVESHETEWGYEFFDPFNGGKLTLPADNEADARADAAALDGSVKVREVFVTEGTNPQ
jgi:hypothetical protein